MKSNTTYAPAKIHYRTSIFSSTPDRFPFDRLWPIHPVDDNGHLHLGMSQFVEEKTKRTTKFNFGSRNKHLFYWEMDLDSFKAIGLPSRLTLPQSEPNSPNSRYDGGTYSGWFGLFEGNKDLKVAADYFDSHIPNFLKEEAEKASGGLEFFLTEQFNPILSKGSDLDYSLSGFAMAVTLSGYMSKARYVNGTTNLEYGRISDEVRQLLERDGKFEPRGVFIDKGKIVGTSFRLK